VLLAFLEIVIRLIAEVNPFDKGSTRASPRFESSDFRYSLNKGCRVFVLQEISMANFSTLIALASNFSPNDSQILLILIYFILRRILALIELNLVIRKGIRGKYAIVQYKKVHCCPV
jgi:hypothetical protein